MINAKKNGFGMLEGLEIVREQNRNKSEPENK